MNTCNILPLPQKEVNIFDLKNSDYTEKSLYRKISMEDSVK